MSEFTIPRLPLKVDSDYVFILHVSFKFVLVFHTIFS